MGEARRDAFWVGFDRAIKLEFHGAKVSSDAGIFPYRDLDEASQLTDSGAAELFDFRTGTQSIPDRSKRLELGFPGGRGTLVIGKLGGGAGQRSYGKCQPTFLRIVRHPYEGPHHVNLLVSACNSRQRGELEIYTNSDDLKTAAERLGAAVGSCPYW